MTAPLTAAKIRKQPECPSTDDWTTMWCVYPHDGTLPVTPKGRRPGIVTGMADAEAETPVLWPPKVKS